MSTGNKTALVTGAAKRIGAAIAIDLAQHGYNVIVHFSGSADDAERVVEAITKRSGKAAAIRANLTDLDETKKLVDRARELHGPIQLLVNNASIFEPDGAERYDHETWERHFAIHTRAPAILAAGIVAQKDADAGSIINIIDQRVSNLNPGYFSYTLSKAALWTATRTMAQSYAPKFRVNAIGPGPTLPNKRQSEQKFKSQIKALPLEEGPKLTEFGATVRYLHETPSVTGQMIMLDGGQHLSWQTADYESE